MSIRWRRLRPDRTADPAASVATGTLGVATVAVTLRFLTALLVNAPSTPGAAPLSALETASTVAAAAALVAGGLRAATPTAGVGALFGGVFGLLAAGTPVATVPATVALAGGTAVFVGAHRDVFTPLSGVAVALLTLALAWSSLSGVVGVAPARRLGSIVAFLALGALPALGTADVWSLVSGAVGLAVTLWFAYSLPFVAGAVTLVTTGAVGTPLPVVAVAVAGVVTAGSAALRVRRWWLVAGVALVAAAGVPVTVTRAVPFALGVTALVRGVDR
ncbi:phosphate ABC transporter permease [Haloarcula sp. S1CR25-12]|uniref:Phosphate ABC transporter permease n=1 Tax=Haloarcula saliterrae TaxID=2950534 RepID=A0ABU2FHH5_9EURY|nr:phosphate ABC transporter permease [Haloarcula sp. S1CR25-12]MDS0261226.1 phosphate ABC transporter permease [Haloarcula sp. S1CR25-12]